jgi:hypothetical protein
LEYKFEREEIERKKNGCKYRVLIETGIPCAISYHDFIRQLNPMKIVILSKIDIK